MGYHQGTQTSANLTGELSSFLWILMSFISNDSQG